MSLSFSKKLFLNPLVIALGKRRVKKKFSDTPVLIGGCGRSGTTLLLSIMGAHPKIYAIPEELGVFIEWHNSVSVSLKKNTEKEVPRIDRFYRYMLYHKIPRGVTRWCEKSPRNVRHIGKTIDYLDGDVKIIHIIRDARDVLLSRHPNAPDKYWVPIDRWIIDVNLGLKYKDDPRVMTVKYENLILNYQETIKKICDFMDEECPPQMKEWINHTNVQDNQAWEDGVTKLHSKSIGKWKTTEDKERVDKIMGNPKVVELMEKLKYI
ncbi:MAG: sulfotransferase family protein [Elusimicrobiota bacterium]